MKSFLIASSLLFIGCTGTQCKVTTERIDEIPIVLVEKIKNEAYHIDFIGFQYTCVY